MQSWPSSRGSNLRTGSGRLRAAHTGVKLLLSQAQRIFAQKLLLPKARRSGFSSQGKQRGIKTKRWNTKYEVEKKGKRLVTNDCGFFWGGVVVLCVCLYFWLRKKFKVICSAGGYFNNFKGGEGPCYYKKDTF